MMSKSWIDRRSFLAGLGGAAALGCVPDAPTGRRSDAGSMMQMMDPRDAGTTKPAPGDAGFEEIDGGHIDAGEIERDAGNPDSGPPDAGVVCDDPFENGTMVGLASFVGEGSSPLERQINRGWDARYYTDLSTVTPEDTIISNERHFLRTEYPDTLDPNAPWSIDVNGLVNNNATITPTDLAPDVVPQGAHVLECSGNHRGGGFGLLSAAEWSGVPLTQIIQSLDIQASATRVRVAGYDNHSIPSSGGHSTPGASWVFTFDQLAETGAFLATKMNGVDLPRAHGFPVRLYVPRWYGCSNIKWVNEISLVDDNVASTSQMREFASRTHQNGVPTLARNFRPAAMHQAAMPTRVERWSVNGQTTYRVVGIMWGGFALTNALEIRFGSGSYRPVDVCPVMSTNETWTVWSHQWTPTSTGRYGIRMRINDSGIPTQRLDSNFYFREVSITQV